MVDSKEVVKTLVPVTRDFFIALDRRLKADFERFSV